MAGGQGGCLIEANLWGSTTSREAINIVSCCSCGNSKKICWTESNVSSCEFFHKLWYTWSGCIFSLRKQWSRYILILTSEIFVRGHFIFVNLCTGRQCYQPTINQGRIYILRMCVCFSSSRDGFDFLHISLFSVSNQQYTRGND